MDEITYPSQTSKVQPLKFGNGLVISYSFLNFGGPFYKRGLIFIPAWISNYIHHKVWDEITYPFPNFNGATVEVWEWISNIIPHFLMDVITCPWWDQSQSPWTRRRTTLSSALFLKVFAFHKICHWNTFLKVQMTTTQSRFRHVTAPPKGREPITLKHSSRRHICRVCDVQRCKFVGFLSVCWANS